MSNDLISREALLEEIVNGKNKPEIYDGAQEVDWMMHCISTAPAVDAQSVKHSRAVKIYDNPYTGNLYTTCLRCAQKISPKDAWCKHCGALLDLEDLQ